MVAIRQWEEVKYGLGSWSSEISYIEDVRLSA